MGVWLLDILPEVAFEIFGIPIRFYAICILVGALLALFVSQRIIRSYGYGKEIIGDMFLYAFIGGLVGARLWYVIANIHEFLDDGNIFEILWSMISVWDGGLAVQGGVILGAICGFWFLFKNYPDKKKFPKGLIADAIIPNILIAQVLGRWGNFFNQEVFGNCVPVAGWEFLPNFIIEQMQGGKIVCTGNEMAFPLFLIEGTINFIGWLLITFVIRYFWTKRKDGYLSCLYFIWYGVVRMILEPFRNEQFNMSFTKDGIHTSMLMSGLFIVGGILVMCLINYSEKRKDTYGQVDDPNKVLTNSILTLTLSRVYFSSKTARYLSRYLDDNNYAYDCFMLAVCPFYGVKFYKKYGELCYQELKDRNIEIEGLEEFRDKLKSKSYIPFAASPYLAKYMNALYLDDAKKGEKVNA